MTVAVQGLAGELRAICLSQAMVLLQRVVLSWRFDGVEKTLNGSMKFNLLGLGTLRPFLEK
jgi:hypothetical protein